MRPRVFLFLLTYFYRLIKFPCFEQMEKIKLMDSQYTNFLLTFLKKLNQKSLEHSYYILIRPNFNILSCAFLLPVLYIDLEEFPFAVCTFY